MIKPANIILTLVGTAMVGGSAWNATHPRRHDDDDWGSSSSGRNLAPNPTFQNNYHVSGMGYYHAPYHAFYPTEFNFHDSVKGYYYGGSWYPTPSTSTVTSSTPLPEVLARLRRILASGTATQEYPNNYYVPGMGYYHAPYHSFFPFQYNYFDPGRGYYYGGMWSPTASPSILRSSTPSAPVMSQLSRAFSTGTWVSSSGGHSFGSGTGGHSSSSSVSRGGFGASGHGSGSSS